VVSIIQLNFSFQKHIQIIYILVYYNHIFTNFSDCTLNELLKCIFIREQNYPIVKIVLTSGDCFQVDLHNTHSSHVGSYISTKESHYLSLNLTLTMTWPLYFVFQFLWDWVLSTYWNVDNILLRHVYLSI
jgi:hypothetical protein